MVPSDLNRAGHGYALLHSLIGYATLRGLSVLNGQVMADNKPMLALAHEAGFRRVGFPESGVVQFRLE